MKISYNFNEITNTLNILYELERDDLNEYVNSESLTIRFTKQNCEFVLPKAFNRNEHLHNDSVALSALLLVYPFIGNRILFNFPISEDFAKILNSSGKKIIYRKDKITPRSISRGVDGIHFNGSTSSIALSQLLNDDTILALFDDSNNNKDFQYLFMDLSYIHNKRIVSIKTDANDMFTEYYKNKPSRNGKLCFELAEYIPLLLLSDYYNIKNININSHITDIEQLVMEYRRVDYYRIGRWKFYNGDLSYKNMNRLNFWRDLFRGVGIQLQFPLGGLTSIGIHKIVKNSPLYPHLPLCTTGFIDKRCNGCKNCLIHSWMNWYYNGVQLNFDMDKLKSSKIIYAYTIFYYRESEDTHLRSLYGSLLKRYPDIHRQMKTLQKYRSDSIISNHNIIDKLKGFGLEKNNTLL